MQFHECINGTADDKPPWQHVLACILPAVLPEILIGVVVYWSDLLMRWVETKRVPWKGRM